MRYKVLTFRSPDGRDNNPFRRGLGIYTDVEGRLWEVTGVLGGDTLEESTILAREFSQHVDTDEQPYRVKIETGGDDESSSDGGRPLAVGNPRKA
jgi:hypothetical protein